MERTDVRTMTVPPVAGVALVHDLGPGVTLDTRDCVEWAGTPAHDTPILVRHRLGDTAVRRMTPTVDVPPWCTYYLDADGEPAVLFHAVFGEVARLMRTVSPGYEYTVWYEHAPHEPVIPLQIDLTAFSLAISSRGRGLIAHSCGFLLDESRAVLCPGVSGTGKTTLATLLRELPDPPLVLSDDRTIVTNDGEGVRLWGSPWPGAARLASPHGAPLAAVVFPRHGKSCELRAVSPGEAFRRILNALSLPLWDAARCGAALGLVDAIVSSALLVEASYPPTRGAATWLRQALAHHASERAA